MTDMWRLVSYGFRSWKTTKGLAGLAILALALGIGCATAIFTVVNVVLIRPLPYQTPDRWVAIFGGSTLAAEADRISSLSIADLMDYKERTHNFAVFGWYALGGDFNLTSPGEPEHIQGVEVTPSLVENVGINPIVGSMFHESDGKNVALISSRLWKRLGEDRGIIGKSITLNGQFYTVTGVMPPSFQLPIVSVASSGDVHNDVWIPVNTPTDQAARRNIEAYAGYALVKEGVTITQAREDAKHVAAEIVKENVGRSRSSTVVVTSLKDSVVKDIRPFLLLFLVAAALLLLITCANVAGLLVTRSVSRAQEISMRVALGARKSHLAAQFLLEGCLISIPAAALGVLGSIGLTRIVLSLAAEYIPRAGEISIDSVVLLFAACLAVLTGMLPSLAPLWQTFRTHPNELLNNGIRATAGSKSRGISRLLVTAEVTLSFLLLATSGLLIAELQNLRHTWPGFDAAHLLTFQFNAAESEFSSGKEFAVHQKELLKSLETLPGVTGAAFANQLPLEGCCISTSIFPEGQPTTPEFSQPVSFMVVSPEYFKTLRIPLQKGRLLTESDNHTNPIPIVLDEAAASRYWQDRDPIGAFGRVGKPTGAQFQVIGVVGNVHNDNLGTATRPEVYFLNALSPMDPMQFVVRSELPATTLIPAVRKAIQDTAPSRPIYAIHTMQEIVEQSVTFQRFDSVVVTFFALAALLLASLGIYSVTAYSVRQRTVEIGTRMALGATRNDLLLMVVGSALKMAGYGILVGAAGSVIVTWTIIRYLSLHHIGALPYALSVITIAAVTTLASLFPAWRATLLSPMTAMRN
jgi:putative ABC transport system permease protein